jgi:rhodanese-related sulfurtransferase
MQNIDVFSSYLENFDYQERVDMKIKRDELLELFAADKAQVIDIRFKEEYEAWSVGFIKNIPLNELPKRLDELDKSKTIVTVCPHYDRAEIARLYLKLEGFNARYLTDGLFGVMDILRGDKARDYMRKIKK